jgi:hypothetical protein
LQQRERLNFPTDRTPKHRKHCQQLVFTGHGQIVSVLVTATIQNDVPSSVGARVTRFITLLVMALENLVDSPLYKLG